MIKGRSHADVEIFWALADDRVGGFGGTDALEEQGEGFAKQRSEQGYGGERDMRRDVGA